MSIPLEEMKAIVQRFAVEPWQDGNLDVLDEVCSPDYSLNDGRDLQYLKDAIVGFRKSFPDLEVTLKEMIAEGDWVAYRWMMAGTFKEALGDMAPTGGRASTTGITIVRFADGKIVHDQYESGELQFDKQTV